MAPCRCAGVLRQDRERPGRAALRRAQDDLISKLIHVEEGGDRYSDAELIGTSIVLLIAGHDHPELLRRPFRRGIRGYSEMNRTPAIM